MEKLNAHLSKLQQWLAAAPHPCPGASASMMSGRTSAGAGRIPRRRRTGNRGSPPILAQYLVGEVVGVLENGQPRHQSRRQWRPGRLVLIDRPESGLNILHVPYRGVAPARADLLGVLPAFFGQAPAAHHHFVVIAEVKFDVMQAARAGRTGCGLRVPRLATLTWRRWSGRAGRTSRCRAWMAPADVPAMPVTSRGGAVLAARKIPCVLVNGTTRK